MVTWPMTSRDPRRCREAVRSAILATAWLLVIFFTCAIMPVCIVWHAAVYESVNFTYRKNRIVKRQLA